MGNRISIYETLIAVSQLKLHETATVTLALKNIAMSYPAADYYGHPVETGLVIAGTDPLAADVVGAQLLGFGVQGVRHLWEADRLGIGESDVKNMDFPEMGLKEAIQAFTKAAYGEALTFEHA